jgi:hypothetical protein
MIRIFAVCLTFLMSATAFAQPAVNVPSVNWSIETELIQPFYPTVQIIRLQGIYRVTPLQNKLSGDLIVGLYLRPNVKHDVVEKINEYMLIAGYRQYLWKGLHLEAKLNSGYAWGTKNLIDGKDYETFTLFYESNLGYKFKFLDKTDFNLYLTPQFGILGNARNKDAPNIGPRGGKPDTFFQGNLLIGINF